MIVFQWLFCVLYFLFYCNFYSVQQTYTDCPMNAHKTCVYCDFQAHAKAWHVYDDHFRATQKGKVSIVLGSHWVEPQSGQNTADNIELCQQSMEAVLGWFANPIFGDGGYPASLNTQHGSLMPAFSPEEKLQVKNTADFFALSFGPNNLRLGQGIGRGQTVTLDLRRLLGWIKHQYGNPHVLVAEGGWFTEASAGLEDTVAMYLMKLFINQVLQGKRTTGECKKMRCKENNRKKHFSLLQLLRSMECRCLATPPGRWWMDLSGLTASTCVGAFSTSTSANRTEPGALRLLLSTTGRLLLMMVFLVMISPMRSKAVSPVSLTGVLPTLHYRWEDR